MQGTGAWDRWKYKKAGDGSKDTNSRKRQEQAEQTIPVSKVNGA